VVCDRIPIATGQCIEKVFPHWTGCVRKSSILDLLTDWDFLSQIGKGIIAVNGVTLAQKGCGVKFEIFLCAFDFGGCYNLKS
jgi:hypothetical protein